MSEYKTHLQWKRETQDFTYDSYDRSHVVTFGGGTVMRASSAPDYRGDATLANPEEMLVAALSSCHMLTFLALAARKRLTLDAYEDDAVGRMTKNAAGKLFVSHVTLQPKVHFSTAVEAAVIEKMHHQAHAECFVANSVLAEVTVSPR